MSLSHFKKNVDNYLYDHYKLKSFLNNGGMLFIALATAFVFSFGFCCFIKPGSAANPSINLITGGVSGLSQIISEIFMMCGVKLGDLVVEAIGYTCFNIPLIILAFVAIGKRFAIYTVINVATTSLLLYFLPKTGLTDKIANNPVILNGHALRIIFGAICTGVSSATAFKFEFSCGGIDILTYYFSLRKSSGVGKYLIVVNAAIVLAYSVLAICYKPEDYEIGIICFFCAIMYLAICSIIVDLINLRNKKIQIQIITSDEGIADILLSHFPHSATIVKGKGAYSGADKFIMYTVVSPYEVKKAVYLIRTADPHAFVSVTSLVQVYGNFFIKPIK